jgi:hypothetical protein
MASFSNFKSTIVAAANEEAGISTGVTVYATRSSLPISGNSQGDQAYVTGNNRLYIWNGSGWYNVALLNVAPSIASVQDSDGGTTPFSLATDGTATTITITATDSDGDPVTYEYSADSDFSGLATISQDSSVFTITPFSSDSATTESGTITFTATDGINTGTSGVQTFTLNFLSALWNEVALSVGTSSTDGLANSTFIDRSTNAHTVTATGTPTQTAFHPYLNYWSVVFDGDVDKLTAAASSSFAFGTGDFTMECFVYTSDSSAPSSYAGIMSVYNGGGATGPIIEIYNGNWAMYNGSGHSVFTSVVLNTWHHVAITRESGTQKMWLNGALLGSVSNINDFTANNPCYIGGLDGNNTYPYTGYISNARVVKGTALYTSAFTPPTAPLTDISGTSLLACTANRFIDTSSNDHTITASGNPVISALNPFGQESEYAAGENKGSTYFDGTNDGLSIANDSSTQVADNDFTFECWMYPTSDSDVRVIFGQGSSGVYAPFGIWQSGTGIILGASSNGSSWDVYSPSTPAGTLNINAWNHVAFIRDGNSFGLFLNGARIHNFTSSATLMTPTQPTTLGVRPSSDQDYVGYISDFRLAVNTADYDPTSTSITAPTSPVGNTNASLYLPMDNAGIFDKAGNYTIIPVGDASTSTTQTKFADTSMYFDGNDYISIPYTIAFGTVDFTIEMWVNITSTTDSYGRLIENGAYNTNDTWRINYNNTASSLLFQIGNTGTRPQIATSTALTLGSWYHIAVCREGNTIRMFVNGTQEGGDLSYSGSLVAPTQTGYLYLGTGLTSSSSATLVNFYNGYLENVQILPGVAKYTTNFTPPTQEQGRTYQASS